MKKFAFFQWGKRNVPDVRSSRFFLVCLDIVGKKKYHHFSNVMGPRKKFLQEMQKLLQEQPILFSD